MRFLTALFLFSVATVAHAQIIVGDTVPSKEELTDAQQKLDAANPKFLKLKAGEFQVLFPAKGIETIPLTWDYSDDSVLEVTVIPAGESHSITGIMAGDTVKKVHRFPARPAPWVILNAVKKGTTTIKIWRNGDKTEVPPKQNPPVRTGQVVVTVDGGVPPGPGPDDPPAEDETQLTKDLRASLSDDKKAAKYDEKWIKELAGVYDKAAKIDMSKITTVAALDTVLNNTRLASGMPEADVMLPTTRNLIRKEFFKTLGTAENDRNATIATDAMRLLQKKFGDIAKSLTIIVP